MRLTPRLRRELTEAWEAERPYWGDEALSFVLGELATVPDGEPLPAATGIFAWPEDPDWPNARGAELVAVAISYYGLLYDPDAR